MENLFYYIDCLIDHFTENASNSPELFSKFRGLLNDFYMSELTFDFYEEDDDYISPTKTEVLQSRRGYEEEFEKMYRGIMDSGILFKLRDRIDRVDIISKKV